MKAGLRCLASMAVALLLPVWAWSADEGITLENVVSPGPNRSDEPYASEFSLQQAIRFLDSAALTWQKERQCFACHSNYVFLMARPAVAHEVLAHRQIRQRAAHRPTRVPLTPSWRWPHVVRRFPNRHLTPTKGRL
jgi:hypothetical protein